MLRRTPPNPGWSATRKVARGNRTAIGFVEGVIRYYPANLCPFWCHVADGFRRLADDSLSHHKCPNARQTPSDRQCCLTSGRTITVRPISNEKRMMALSVRSDAIRLENWPVYSLISEACPLEKERADLRSGRVPSNWRDGDWCRALTPQRQHDSGRTSPVSQTSPTVDAQDHQAPRRETGARRRGEPLPCLVRVLVCRAHSR